jgi:predicted RNase H-like nuclease (RuvC/YqgF family)
MDNKQIEMQLREAQAEITHLRTHLGRSKEYARQRVELVDENKNLHTEIDQLKVELEKVGKERDALQKKIDHMDVERLKQSVKPQASKNEA